MGITAIDHVFLLESPTINPHPIWNDEFYQLFNERFNREIGKFTEKLGRLSQEEATQFFDIEEFTSNIGQDEYLAYVIEIIKNEYNNDPSRVDDGEFEDAEAEGWEINNPEEIFYYLANQSMMESYVPFERELLIYLAQQKFAFHMEDMDSVDGNEAVYINNPQISLFATRVGDWINYVDLETRKHYTLCVKEDRYKMLCGESLDETMIATLSDLGQVRLLACV